MKRKAEVTRARLETLRVALHKRKDLLRVIVAEKALKHQAKKAQLQENNITITLDKLEQKLRTINSNNYQMADFIKTKESETNCKSLAMSITHLSEEINLHNKRAYA